MSHWYACFAMPDPNMEASKPREYPSLVDMGKALLIPGGVSSVVVLLLGFGGLWLELEVTYPQQTSYETLYATSLLPTKVVIGYGMRFLLMALGYSFVALVLASPLVAILSGWQHRRRTLAILAMAIVAVLLLDLLFAAAFRAVFTPAEKVLLTEVTDPAQRATFFLQKLLQADSVLLILVAYPLLTLSVLAGIVGGLVLVRDLRRSHRTGANAGSLEGPSPPWWWHLRRGLATTYTLSIVATLLVLALDFGGYGNLNAREMKLSLPEARLQSTVELAPGKTMTGGTLLAHTDGYWHLLDDQGNVVSIADSEAGAGVIVISSPE